MIIRGQINVAGVGKCRVPLNAEQDDWKDDTDDESDDQELEAHYMYLAQLQEATPDPDDQDETDDLDQERDLLASLIQKLKVIPTTSVSRPQLKSNQLEDRVMSNNSQGKKQKVEDHHRNFKFSNNKTSVTACNDSLNAKTLNVNFIILFIVDSGCSKHMTRNLKLLTNFVEKFLGTVKFGNDQIAPILGYGDLVQGRLLSKGFILRRRVLNLKFIHSRLVKFCDVDLKVAFSEVYLLHP
ncbi:hypothetical protein Tco_0153843 [Tanacetum coccineum]